MRDYSPSPFPGVPLFVMEKVVSTFDAAWKISEERITPPWSSVLAHTQTGGRGQLRRLWHSPPGNLYVSFFLPESITRTGNMASLAVGWCVHKSLAKLGVNTRLKWPNDLLFTNPEGLEGKLGGIMLEEKNGRVLAGLGLNIKTAPDETGMRPGHAMPAIALHRNEEPVAFWVRIIHSLRDVYETDVERTSLESMCLRIEDSLAWMGTQVYAEDGGIYGRIVGISLDGALKLQMDGKKIITVDSGSIAPIGLKKWQRYKDSIRR